MNQTKENGIALFATNKWLQSLINHGIGKVKRRNHSRSSLHALCSRAEQIELSKKANLTQEIEQEERDLIFPRRTTTATTIVEYYDDETGTTYNPLRQFPLPDKFNYDWLLNYTVSQETENTMFNENENKNYADVETLPGSLDYEKVFGTPDQKSGEFTVHPGINSSEFSDWNPSEETLKELRNVSRVMQSMTFNTDYYEVDGVKYTPPLVDIPEVNIDDYTGDIPDWYKKFEKEVIEKWTLPTIKTSKKWRWMVSRDRERARLSSLGLLTPWPTTTKYTGDPFEDSNDSYFNNDLVFNATES